MVAKLLLKTEEKSSKSGGVRQGKLIVMVRNWVKPKTKKDTETIVLITLKQSL